MGFDVCARVSTDLYLAANKYTHMARHHTMHGKEFCKMLCVFAWAVGGCVCLCMRFIYVRFCLFCEIFFTFFAYNVSQKHMGERK